MREPCQRRCSGRNKHEISGPYQWEQGAAARVKRRLLVCDAVEREDVMDSKNYAAETGGASSATDVSTELTALRADMVGLADSVKRLAGEAPDLARDSLESSI